MFRNAFAIMMIFAIALSFTTLSQSHTQDKSPLPQQSVSIPEISTPKTEEMIDVGGRKLHCCVYGKKGPTVVLISGIRAPQSYWNPVVPDLAAHTTVVTFDRAGVGKSEIGDLPTHGVQSAKDLHSLLEKLEVPTPYIVVGHSYGGNVARLFASMYPDHTGGLILEDTQHEDIKEEQRNILKGADLEAFEQMAARFSTPDNPKTELDYRDITTEQIKKSKPLPRVPFVVLTAGDRSKAMPPMFSEDAKKELAALGLRLQKKLVALIPDGEHIVVEGVGHNIHVEKPDALIDPVVKMLNEIRK
ncbi:MAG: alpha/beta hydrolase [Candidatus Latescibacterota bacterium]|nr:MAG: alpha/beta hydrolase [Candidatus Latescibacterota bacterium]